MGLACDWMDVAHAASCIYVSIFFYIVSIILFNQRHTLPKLEANINYLFYHLEQYTIPDASKDFKLGLDS